MNIVWRMSVPVLAAVAVLAFVVGAADASVMTWYPPAVKKVMATPSNAAVVGKAVSIECVVGAAGEIKLDTNSPQGKYLAQERKPSWTVPVEIRVNGKVLGHYDDAGLSSLTATWKHQAAWTPSAADAGKPAAVECVADPVKKIFFSTQSLSLPVLGKEVPRVRMSDQPPPTMKAVPPAVVPLPPKR